MPLPDGYKILERKPRDSFNEYILVDRGEGTPQRYVSATANAQTLAHGEWFWGHYFDNIEKAYEHFNGR